MSNRNLKDDADYAWAGYEDIAPLSRERYTDKPHQAVRDLVLTIAAQDARIKDLTAEFEIAVQSRDNWRTEADRLRNSQRVWP